MDATEIRILRPKNTMKIILWKKYYLEINRRLICIEHVYLTWKRFTILSSFYINYQKRLGLRLNFIAAIYTLE